MKNDENITYKCPVCSYKSKKKSGVIAHYRFTHGGGKGKIPDEDIVILKENAEEGEQEVQTEKINNPIDIPKPVVPLNTNIGTTTSKSVSLAGMDLALIEGLEKSGFGTNMNDIMRKSLHFAANTLMKEGGANMPKEELDPIEKLQKQRLYDVQLKTLEKDATQQPPAQADDMDRLEKIYMQKMRMKAMNDDDFSLKDMMTMMMVKSMMPENKPSVDPAITQMMQDLRSEIQSLRNEKEQQMMLQKIESMIPKTNPESGIDRFYAMSMNKDKDNERTRLEMMQKEKEFMAQLNSKDKELLTVALQNQIQGLSEKLAQIQQGGLGKSQLSEMKDQIEIIKELNKLVGKGGETSKWDAASQILGNVADKLNPTLTSYFESKAQERQMRQQYAQPVPQQVYPSEQQPMPMQPMDNFSNPSPMMQRGYTDDEASKDIINMISQQDNFDEKKQ